MMIFQTGSKQAENGTFSFQSGRKAVEYGILIFQQNGNKSWFFAKALLVGVSGEKYLRYLG
ncbi:MAG: hypothetical protein J6Y17_00920 [Elusimicrobiaceae bacterium]|nr:hypothetical protein [Elusimicrobiaceae bacterium]